MTPGHLFLQIEPEKGWCAADTDSKVQRFERWPFVREKHELVYD